MEGVLRDLICTTSATFVFGMRLGNPFPEQALTDCRELRALVESVAAEAPEIIEQTPQASPEVSADIKQPPAKKLKLTGS